MPTTIFEAKPYDPIKERRKRLIVWGTIIVVVVVSFLVWWFRFLPYEHRVDKFFDALQQKQYETAYGIWMNDSDWKQHPQKYDRYPEPQFILDWGPSSEYGAITKHTIDCATEPPKKGFASPSGVIVVATINGRSKSTSLWVEKKSGSVSESPQEVLCHTP